MQHASSSNTVQPNNVANNVVSNSPCKETSKTKKIPKKLSHIPYSCLDNGFTRLRPPQAPQDSPTTVTEGNPPASLSNHTSTLNIEPSFKNAEDELQGVVLRQNAQDSSPLFFQSYDGNYILPSAYNEHNSSSHHNNEDFLSSSHCDERYPSSSHYSEHYPSSSGSQYYEHNASSSNDDERSPSSSHYSERYPSSSGSHDDERYPSFFYSNNNYPSSYQDHSPPLSQYRVENYPTIQDNSQPSYVCSLAYALGPPENSRSYSTGG